MSCEHEKQLEKGFVAREVWTLKSKIMFSQLGCGFKAYTARVFFHFIRVFQLQPLKSQGTLTL